MPSETTNLGKIGENLAIDYLKKRNYKILATNFWCDLGEVDIIAIHNNIIKFIEVKTRKSLKYGLPYEAVNKFKIRKITNIAYYYILVNKLNIKNIGIEVVSIIYKNSNDFQLKHIKVD